MTESHMDNPIVSDLLRKYPDRGSTNQLKSLEVDALQKIIDNLNGIFPGDRRIPHDQLQTIYTWADYYLREKSE